MINIDDKELKRWRKVFKSPKMTMDQAKAMQGKFSAAGKAGNVEGKSKGGKASAAKRWNEEWNKKRAVEQERRIRNYVYTSFEMAIDVVAARVQYDIKEKFESEVDRFYSDPVFNGSAEPEVYDRTGSLYQAYKPVYRKIGDAYCFGAEIDGQNIKPTPYHGLNGKQDVDPQYVFNLFYKLGSHGANILFMNYTAPLTSPSAQSEMHKWWDKYKHAAHVMLNEEFHNMLRKNKKMLKG